MSIIKSIRAQIAPIHGEGYPFVGAFALVSLILFLFWAPLGWIGTVLTIWSAKSAPRGVWSLSALFPR